MVDVVSGNLFDAGAQTLVNTVNCVGVMGKGVALGFKQRFPAMYRDYVARCKRGEVRLGEPYLYCPLVEPWILNFPTKDHWRSVSRIQDIVDGLNYLERHYKEWGITSLAVPPLGCGNGGLDWRVVGPTLHRHLERLDIPVTLFAPAGTPDEQMDRAFLAKPAEAPGIGRSGGIEPAWVALAVVVDRITRERFHRPVGRIMFQKIAYFITELGLPTHLEFRRGSFGPFSGDVKQVLTRLINNGILVEEKMGNTIAVKLGDAYPDAVRLAERDLAQWNDIIEKVSDLALRVTTQRYVEVAATVHRASNDLNQQLGRVPTEDEVLHEVQRWKIGRRPPLSDFEVTITVHDLAGLGWIDVDPREDSLGFDDLAYA